MAAFTTIAKFYLFIKSCPKPQKKEISNDPQNFKFRAENLNFDYCKMFKSLFSYLIHQISYRGERCLVLNSVVDQNIFIVFKIFVYFRYLPLIKTSVKQFVIIILYNLLFRFIRTTLM